jgi:hypothetical protein
MLQTWKDPTSHSWIWIGGFDTIVSYSRDAATRIQAELEAADPALVTDKIRIGYEAFFNCLPPNHLAFFTGLKLYYETDDVVCAHAGVDIHGRALHSQDPELLLWGGDGFPDKYRGERPVVYGHWENAVLDEGGRPRPRLLENRTFGIDTISKGVLTAMRFPDGEIFQSKKLNPAL